MTLQYFQKQYDKYKNIIIEEMIQEFGEGYRDIIIEKINKHVIVFQGNPIDDYIYLCEHADNIEFIEQLNIKERYHKLQKIKEKARNSLMKKFKSLIEYFFRIDNNIIFGKNSKDLVSLFANQEFDASYIDFYNFDNMTLLIREDIPQVVKEYILNNQGILKDKLEEYGIIVNQNFFDSANHFIKERNQFKWDYYYKILASNFSYNKELSNYLSEKNLKILYYSSFYPNPCRYILGGSNNQVIYGIFFPIVRFLNENIKAIDVAFIHELNHVISNDEQTGILNEVMVQKAAINIVRRLHERGIFIFDNPNDYKIEGECIYEVLFPIIGPLLLNYYDILKDTLLSDNFYSLDRIFGESWSRFLVELENIFFIYKQMKSTIKLSGEITWELDTNNINKYMEEMDTFYRGRDEKEQKLKKNLNNSNYFR